MDSSGQSRTSTTLLQHVQRGDQDAWEKFEKRYRPKIQAWCRYWNVRRDDGDEIAQIVFTKLVQKMRTFVYDRSGSFRAWLKTVTFRAWQDYADAQPAAVSLVTITPEAGQSLVQHIEDEFDLELLQKAMAQVQERVQPRSWEAWRLLALEEKSGKEVAAQLGMSTTAVFMSRSRVQGLIRDRIRELEDGMG